MIASYYCSVCSFYYAFTNSCFFWLALNKFIDTWFLLSTRTKFSVHFVHSNFKKQDSKGPCLYYLFFFFLNACFIGNRTQIPVSGFWRAHLFKWLIIGKLPREMSCLLQNGNCIISSPLVIRGWRFSFLLFMGNFSL